MAREPRGGDARESKIETKTASATVYSEETGRRTGLEKEFWAARHPSTASLGPASVSVAADLRVG